MSLSSSGIWLKLNALPYIIAIRGVFLVFYKIREGFRATRTREIAPDRVVGIVVGMPWMLVFLMTLQDLFACRFKFTAINATTIIV
jgi:hypothetical protein